MCYVCKSLVLLGDYEVHVDRCLQEASSETRSTRRAKCAKEPSGREGRLLSMLEQSEAVSADNRALDISYMSPPREEHADNFTSKQLSISDSPIRSFVSISEAKDCLVDFKKQLNPRPSHRPNRGGYKHRGKGRKRRM